MLTKSFLVLCTFAMVQAFIIQSARGADVGPRPQPSDAEEFCKNAAPSVEEMRIRAQLGQLRELNKTIEARMVELQTTETKAAAWVRRRNGLLQAASESLTAIYSKMSPDSAAAQLGTMDDNLAASILAKLKPRVASSVMAEMDAAKAGRLVVLLSGAATSGSKL